MTNEYIENRINFVNNKVSLKNYKEEIKHLKYQRALLVIGIVGMTLLTVFRG